MALTTATGPPTTEIVAQLLAIIREQRHEIAVLKDEVGQWEGLLGKHTKADGGL